MLILSYEKNARRHVLSAIRQKLHNPSTYTNNYYALHIAELVIEINIQIIHLVTLAHNLSRNANKNVGKRAEKMAEAMNTLFSINIYKQAAALTSLNTKNP